MLNDLNSYMTGNLKEDEYNKIRSGFQGSDSKSREFRGELWRFLFFVCVALLVGF